MDEVKFLTALSILFNESKKPTDSEYANGYRKALYDVLQATKFCKDQPCKTLLK